MNSSTRTQLNALTGFNAFYAARHVCHMTPRYQAIAESSGVGDAVLQRREDKAAKRAATKRQRASRRRNR